MARLKVTNTDIYAKLARGECANYLRGSCHGQTPCTIANGEPCDYFQSYVRPLLEYAEFASKYGREAKISLALKPETKVVRKRRAAQATAVIIELQKTPPAVNVPPARKKEEKVPLAARVKEPRLTKPAANIPSARKTEEKVPLATRGKEPRLTKPAPDAPPARKPEAKVPFVAPVKETRVTKSAVTPPMPRKKQEETAITTTISVQGVLSERKRDTPGRVNTVTPRNPEEAVPIARTSTTSKPAKSPQSSGQLSFGLIDEE